LQKNLGIQKEIDCMRRNFMAMASHEFKTPLTLLRGYLEMMRDQVLPQQSLQEAEEVMIEESIF
ncbi:MAG: sensor histidine kinase, partial [Lachnospiraceae bacterium]|nr:sensor histidine kinase [Lachnospiraceae bacterium]